MFLQIDTVNPSRTVNKSVHLLNTDSNLFSEFGYNLSMQVKMSSKIYRKWYNLDILDLPLFRSYIVGQMQLSYQYSS